jgi:transcriptional regulator with XRE-family HTH domain
VTIAEKIKELRKERGLSQVELAVEIDVYPDYISWWESGKRTPSLLNAIALADTFSVSLDELCGRSEQK